MKESQEAVLVPSKEVLRVYLSLTALSALIVVLHVITGVMTRRLGLHIPGFSGIVWMPLLVIGKMKWRTKISATYMAAMSSILVLWLAPVVGIGKMGGMWLFPFFRYGIPGIVLDILWPFAEKISAAPYSRSIARVLATGIAHTSKAAFVILMFTWDLGFGRYILTHFTLTMVVLLHFAFGAAGGLIGSLIGNYHTRCTSSRNIV